MKRKQKNETVYENLPDFMAISKQQNKPGELPRIIADLKVFDNMKKPDRLRFYAMVDTLIPAEYKRSTTLIKAYCLYPEKRLNKAFIRNDGRAKVDMWHTWVGVLEFALKQSILQLTETYENQHDELTHQLSIVNKRKEQLSEAFAEYL